MEVMSYHVPSKKEGGRKGSKSRRLRANTTLSRWRGSKKMSRGGTGSTLSSQKKSLTSSSIASAKFSITSSRTKRGITRFLEKEGGGGGRGKAEDLDGRQR